MEKLLLCCLKDSIKKTNVNIDVNADKKNNKKSEKIEKK